MGYNFPCCWNSCSSRQHDSLQFSQLVFQIREKIREKQKESKENSMDRANSRDYINYFRNKYLILKTLKRF